MSTEPCWVSCLRENFMSSSYGEELSQPQGPARASSSPENATSPGYMAASHSCPLGVVSEELPWLRATRLPPRPLSNDFEIDSSFSGASSSVVSDCRSRRYQLATHTGYLGAVVAASFKAPSCIPFQCSGRIPKVDNAIPKARSSKSSTSNHRSLIMEIFEASVTACELSQ
jgi:hypothetical protein